MSGERAGKLPLRLIARPEPPSGPRAADATEQPIAEVQGINIHATQVVDGRDRRRVERLCKYMTRPPVTQDRLERRENSKLELGFKRAWRDDMRALVFELSPRPAGRERSQLRERVVGAEPGLEQAGQTVGRLFRWFALSTSVVVLSFAPARTRT